jgi:excisionase family DNA binding protein
MRKAKWQVGDTVQQAPTETPVLVTVSIVGFTLPHPLPFLVTVDEAALLLRTSRRAIYAMVERHQLPGVARIGRRVLFRSADLLDWLDQKSALSLKE